ncbi:MAG: Soluble attachment protein [Thermoanaerobaculia bacterium]|jgi:tetratricopeptide (TPR) repeat protein|nr:Soluble attachment protein [Thermoanaerobaculia bacterium]
MMIEQHYDEEVLAGFLDEPIDATARDKHLDNCSLCKRTLQSIRDTVVLLKKPAVWERQRLSNSPRPETLAFLRNVQTTMKDEDAAAERNVALLLAGPRETWAARLDEHPEWRTAGLVRKLIGATDQAIDLMPPDALEITRLACDVAENLPASDRAIRLRGNASYERGYALYYTGAYREALVALEAAESEFIKLTAADHELGRLHLVQAMVYRALERGDDALRVIATAAEVFQAYGDAERCYAAKLFMGITLASGRRFREALAIHFEIANDAIAPRWRASALQNAAICHREIGQIDEAIDCFTKAITAFEAAGMMSFRAKTRWTLARILVERQQYEPALAMFNELLVEFEDLGMANDVAIVALDIAESLLATGRNEGIVGACRQAIAYFEKMQLTTSQPALTAVTYLCEAALAGHATPSFVSDLRSTYLPDSERFRSNPQPNQFLRVSHDQG